MTLPTTYAAALLLTLVSMLCWGSWANTFKLTRRWRFELFYFDYAFGVVLAAVIAAFTFGSSGEGFSVVDNLEVTGKRQWALCLAGGVVFNLANMLLVAAISLSGMAVAFPVGIGLALVVGVAWSHALRPEGNALLLFVGVLLVTAAIVVDALAYRAHSRAAGMPRRGVKGILISFASGILMGSFYPLVEMSRAGDLGLRAYSAGLLFSLGVLLSTLPFNLYFLNVPVHGQPVPISAYFQGTLRQHLLGLLGGLVWCVGLLANFAASSTPPEVNVGPAVSYAIGQGATMVSALWGLLVWKEFAGATSRVKALLAVMLVLFVAGLGLVSVAPLY